MLEEGQEFRRKDKPNVRILVCHIKGNGAWCACDDGYSRYIGMRDLRKYYERVPEDDDEK